MIRWRKNILLPFQYIEVYQIELTLKILEDKYENYIHLNGIIVSKD